MGGPSGRGGHRGIECTHGRRRGHLQPYASAVEQRVELFRSTFPRLFRRSAPRTPVLPREVPCEASSVRSAWVLASIALGLVVMGASPQAAAAPATSSTTAALDGSAPAGGGLGAVTARLDFAGRRLLVRGCASAPCDPVTGEATAISLGDALDIAGSSVAAVSIGAGRRVLLVRARSASRPGVAWEAIVAGGASSAAQVIWSGATGFDAEGEGAGHRVRVEDGAIYVAELHRELTICGQSETLISPHRLDGASMTLHAVALERIGKAARDGATKLEATPATDAPIGSILGVRGASTNDGASALLVDGDPATAWSEARKGDGRGEFVVFSSAKSLPLEKLSLVVRPTKELAGFAQPRSLWVVVDDATYRVELPVVEAGGGRVDVLLPTPASTTCVAIALERAASAATDAVVGLAEVDGVPVVPSTVHTLDDVVTLLDSTGTAVDLATRLLASAGARGARVLVSKLATLGEDGKGRAVEVFESTPCADGAPGLARLSWDAGKETIAAARTALDACGGEASKAIGEAFAAGPEVAREALAERYARVDPKGALEAILAIVPKAAATRRRTYRLALALIAGTSMGRDAIAAWLLAHAGAPSPLAPGESDPTLELGRGIASGADVTAPMSDGRTLVAPLSAALLSHASEAQSFERRWLASAPIAALAAKGDVPSLAWMRALFASSDRYLRARAAEVSSGVDALRPELIGALGDADARVRQHALESLRRGGEAGATSPALGLLAGDAWTFVRVAAADLLGDSKGGVDVDVALAKATDDPAKSVRAASVHALAMRGAKGQVKAIRARALDDEEAIDVRREAIDALGTLCDDASADDLYELAKRWPESDATRSLGLAAIVALGEIHPKDLADRLSAIDQGSMVIKDAVRRALSTKSVCAK